MGKTIPEILLETRTSKGYNKSQMARELKIPSQQYGQYESGKVTPKVDFLKTFENLFSVNIINQPEDDKPGNPNKPTGAEIRRRKALGSDDDDPGLIYVPIAAQAGYTRNFMDPMFINTMERLYIPGLPYKGDNYRYFDVEGDSMYKTIEDGMQVIGQKIEPEYWKDVSNFYIHVLVCENRLLIKRLYKKDDEHFVLISDNQELYPQELLPIEQVKEVWLVKRVLDWRMPPPTNFEINV